MNSLKNKIFGQPERMDVSVVLSTWNNSSLLKTTLESLKLINIPKNVNWECVIVNNNCSDNTDAVVQSFEGMLPIVYIHENRQGLAIAKNSGAKASKGKLIVFTDDDIQPFANWLKTYWVAYSANPKKYFFGGPTESIYEKKALCAELAEFAPLSVKGLDYGLEERVLSDEDYFIGVNWGVDAEIFQELGGFNEQLGLNPDTGKVRTGEEIDIMNRLKQKGLKAMYLPDARLKHFVPQSKCQVKHIMGRKEGLGYEKAMKADINDYDHSVQLKGVPRWLWGQYCKTYFRWVGKKAVGKKAFKELEQLSIQRGFIDGIRERLVTVAK